MYKELEDKVANLIRVLSNDVFSKFQEDPTFWESDSWLSQLDWEVKTTKGKYKGIPNWYRPFIKDPDVIFGTKATLTHTLLRLTWEGYPIFKDKKKGYCYRDENHKLNRVPHYKNEGANTGCIISKNYLPYFDKGTLNSELSEAHEVFEIARSMSYWTSVQSRVKELHIVKDGSGHLYTSANPTPYGTLTGRAVQPLILTMCGVKPNKIGTEMKTRIEAPPGWRIVGADFDA